MRTFLRTYLCSRPLLMQAMSKVAAHSLYTISLSLPVLTNLSFIGVGQVLQLLLSGHTGLILACLLHWKDLSEGIGPKPAIRQSLRLSKGALRLVRVKYREPKTIDIVA